MFDQRPYSLQSFIYWLLLGIIMLMVFYPGRRYHHEQLRDTKERIGFRNLVSHAWKVAFSDPVMTVRDMEYAYDHPGAPSHRVADCDPACMDHRPDRYSRRDVARVSILVGLFSPASARSPWDGFYCWIRSTA